MVVDECSNCCYWEGDRKRDHGVGLCRRYPPVLSPITSGQVIPPGHSYLCVYPSASFFKWCGEYKRLGSFRISEKCNDFNE